jgi:hypothetical protein
MILSIPNIPVTWIAMVIATRRLPHIASSSEMT